MVCGERMFQEEAAASVSKWGVGEVGDQHWEGAGEGRLLRSGEPFKAGSVPLNETSEQRSGLI